MEIRAITDFDLVGGKQEMVAILQDGCRASISLQLNCECSCEVATLIRVDYLNNLLIIN